MAARSDSVGPDSVLEEELDVLRAIYIHELVVEASEDNGSPTVVFLTLHPATGDDVTQQFVCMTVVFKLPNTYPDDLPEITIKNPRGLAEEEVQRLQEDMIQLAEERCGGAMLFELIEMAKEILTEGNIPRCPCVVCMEHFHEGDLFTRTQCYHYFHQACLKRYIEHALTLEPEVKVMHLRQDEKEEPKVVCPVCREEMTFDLEELEQAPSVDDEDLVYKPSESMIKMQREMAEHFAKQKAAGGIIDLEAEKNKYLVNEETVVVMTQDVKGEDKLQKKTDEQSERKRNHKQSDAVVAKYKGPPRRNRPNSNTQGRNSPSEAKDHLKGDHSSHWRNEKHETDRHRGSNRQGDNSSHGRNKRHETDRHGGSNRQGDNSSQWRNERHETDRYRGNRQGDRGRRYGTDRYKQDHRRDDWDRKSGKKDAFDHCEMRQEVEGIQRKDSRGSQDHQRRHERNTNNSCTHENEDNSESVDVSQGNKDQESSEQDKQDKGRESEDWESERTVVNSPDKQFPKEESSTGVKLHSDPERKIDKDHNDRRTSGTRMSSGNKLTGEEISRHREKEDRRNEKSNSQRGRGDWGRRGGGRERREGFHSHRQHGHYEDRPHSRSSENWDAETVACDNSSKQRQSGRSDGQNYRTSSKSENRGDRKRFDERKGDNSYRSKSTNIHKDEKSENWEDESIPVDDRDHETCMRERGRGRGKRGQGRGGRGRRSDTRWQEADKGIETSEDMNIRNDVKNNRRNRGSNYKVQNENSSSLNGETNHKSEKSSHIPTDMPPPPGFKAPKIEAKAEPSSRKPPGIKVPPPDHSSQSAGSSASSPGIRITGPPPGFNSKSQNESSIPGVTPPPGFR